MDRVPNSTDIAELVNQFGKNQAALAGMVKSSLDSLKTFASIKIDKKVKDGIKKMKDVRSTFNVYSCAVRDMIDGLSNLLPKNASPEELNATLSVLSGDPKKTLELFSDSGKKISAEITEEKKGVLDIIGVTLALIKQIAEVQRPNIRKLNRTVKSYSDTVAMLWSFVRSLGDAADPAAALESAKASKTITDAMLNLTGVFTAIQKDLLPLSEVITAFEPSLKRGMRLLYDPEADPEKQFSIISTMIGAAKQAEKISSDKVKQLGALGDSVNKAVKSMTFGFGILGLKVVSDRVLAGTKTLNTIIYDVIECSNLAAGIDPNDMKNLFSAVSTVEKTVGTLSSLYIKILTAAIAAFSFRKLFRSDPLEWLSGRISMLNVPAPPKDAKENAEKTKEITALLLSSINHIDEVSWSIIFTVPRAIFASGAIGYIIKRFNKSLSAVSLLKDSDIKKTETLFMSMSAMASNLNSFAKQMPSRRRIRRSMRALLVIGKILGNEEVQTQFKSAIAAIDLMVGEKDSLSQLNGLLDTVASTMKSAAQAGIWCALGIPGMKLVGIAAEAMKKAVQQLVAAMDGSSVKKIADTRKQFEDLGKMVLIAGATVAVCALVGVLVIAALPVILLGFAAISTVVLVFAGLLRLIDFITGGKQFQSNAKAIADLGRLILLAGAVIAISVLVGLLVIQSFHLILVGFTALMAVTVALIGVLWLIGKVGEIPGLKTGMLMLIAMIMSMMLAALMITIVSKVGAGIDLVGILKFTLTLAIITAAYIGLGLLMAAGGILAIVLATAGIILISVSMLMITGAIASVNKTLSNTDPEQTKNNIGAMLDTMKYTVEYVNENFSVVEMGKAAAKMLLMANMSKHLMRMTRRIQKIASLTMDEFDEAGHPTGKTVKMKTQDFVDAAINGVAVAQTIAAILDSEPTVITTSSGSFTVTGLPDSALERITTKSKRKIRQLSKITKFIGKMATTVADIASLNMATEWNKDGKPVAFQKMTTQDFVNASLNGIAVAKLMAAILDDKDTVIETSVGNVAVKGIPEATLEKITNSTKRKFRQLSKITEFIGRMTTTVTDTASLNMATEWNKDGKPVKFEPITKDQMGAARDNVIDIMTALTDAIVSKEMTDKLNAFDRDKKRAMDRMFSAITPITSMVEAVIALAGGSLEEYDEKGHPTGKQVSVLKALEAKPDIIKGIVSIYSIFTDALAVITGQDSATEATVTQSRGPLGKIADKVASAVATVVDAGASMVKNIQSSIDTSVAAKNIKMIVDPIMTMVDAVKKINETMSTVDLESADNLKYVMAGSVAAVAEIGEEDFTTLERRTKILDEYAKVIKTFMDANSKKETADNVRRTMADTGKFIIQLNKVSDSKLAKMASISKNMADFANKINGNFDKLADTLNEKMVTALDKVDKTLQEVNKVMTDIPEKFRGAVSNIQITGGVTSDDKTRIDGNGVGNTASNNTKQQAAKDINNKNVSGKTVNNCIVQADDGTFALAVIQKYE